MSVCTASGTVPGRRGGVWGGLIWQHYFSPVGSDFLCVCVCGGRWLSPSATALQIHAFTLSFPSTVPPSKPDCAIEGETVIGNNIQLSCQSKEGSPAPQYSWKSYDILNKERPAPAGNGVSREDAPLPQNAGDWLGLPRAPAPGLTSQVSLKGCPRPPASSPQHVFSCQSPSHRLLQKMKVS